MSEESATSLCFVVSAPSGTGKSTLADALLSRVDRLARTISCTTRPVRPGESDGVDYWFVSDSEFERRMRAGMFLEWAEVHGCLYATPQAEIDRIRAAGKDAVMVIDVQGAESLRRLLPDAVSVFVLPPSRDVLVARLFGRDAADAASRGHVERRLAAARDEMAHYVSYDYVIINDVLEESVAELGGIVRAERARREQRRSAAEAILASFDEAEVAPGDAGVIIPE